MDNSMYDYIDVGTVWRSKKRGLLCRIIALSNFSIPEKYHKQNPPQVVFIENDQILSTTVDRFVELREFVYNDLETRDHLYDLFSLPITEELESPSLELEDLDEEEIIEPKVQESLIKLHIDSEEDYSEIESAICGYDQMRTLDGTFYHVLSFDNTDAIHQLFDIDAEQLTVSVGKTKITLQTDLIVSAYSSVTDRYTKHANIIFAEISEEDEEAISEALDESALQDGYAQQAIDEAATLSVNQEQSKTIYEPVIGEHVHSAVNANDETNVTLDEAVSTLSNEIKDSLEEVSINADIENNEILLDEQADENYTNVEDIVDDDSVEELEPNVDEVEDEATLVDLRDHLMMPNDPIDDEESEEIEWRHALADKLEATLEHNEEEQANEATN